MFRVDNYIFPILPGLIISDCLLLLYRQLLQHVLFCSVVCIYPTNIDINENQPTSYQTKQVKCDPTNIDFEKKTEVMLSLANA